MIQITVEGSPRPQQRHRNSVVRRKRDNEPIAVWYDPSKKEKEDFLLLCRSKARYTKFDHPLDVELMFYMKRPKSHFRSGKHSAKLRDDAPTFHTSTPDIDNLVKFVLDALNEHYWTDDRLIVRIIAQKQYSVNPRTEITIRPFDGARVVERPDVEKETHDPSKMKSNQQQLF